MTVMITKLPNEIKTEIEKGTKNWRLQKKCVVTEYPHTVEIVVKGIDDKGRACCKLFFSRKKKK